MNLKAFRKRTKRVRTGVGSDTQNQRNRWNDPPLVADAKIPLSAVVAQHRVPVAQSSRIESYPVDTSCAMLAHLKTSEGAVSHLSLDRTRDGHK
ncbi:hypothetical protein NKI79_26805 [Mesorhizobium sp. M0340]|uniref:hypothetical protein n=1 Tax=Mesorhizobium sp. M0340 TaxID=2956939 RepID=UPI00333685B5